MRFFAAGTAGCLLLALWASPASADAATPTTPVQPGEIVAHLARTIAWYRRVAAVEQSTQVTGDVLARDNAQRTAVRALQLSFDFARAAAPLAGADKPAGNTAAPATTRVQQAAAKAIERVASVEAQIAEVDATLATAKAATRSTLQARRKELLAELGIAKEIKEAMSQLRLFLSGQNKSGGADLLGLIDRLERTVPEATRTAQPAPALPAPPAVVGDEPAGIFALTSEVIALARSKDALIEALAETDTLRKSMDALRTPLVKDLTNAIKRSDSAAADSASQNVEQMDADRQEIEALTARFKRVTAALAPLREHGQQIEVARSSMIEQRNAVQQRYSSITNQLLFRVLALFGTIAVILLISELWRRGTFRYVQDGRRRKQFLLLRRVVVTCVVAVTVVLGLVNELGSLATYAGLLTAGLAVALQNVIASIVAYFFLIGRYGLRVGDRVTISGVTGDVVDIGLVRIYLMEMTGAGADLQATGRVVGFSNSVLFQPVALFRQMPGTDYVWHAVTITLVSSTNQELAQTKLMAAVDSVYEQYRERVEQQHAVFQRMVDMPLEPAKPEGRLRFTDAGLEFLARYPVETRQSSITDDRVVNALSEAITHEPLLVLAPSGAPKVQAA
ncbi:MAG: mechanosensitive ion channel domain-containing protein [Bryobacteraceae bacterium]